MRSHRKVIVDPISFGAALRHRRIRIGKTLQDLAKITSVDVGQLSRFERGAMKLMSRNLQKLIENLQILESADVVSQGDVVNRFAAIVQRSTRHALAAEALVDALEKLM